MKNDLVEIKIDASNYFLSIQIYSLTNRKYLLKFKKKKWISRQCYATMYIRNHVNRTQGWTNEGESGPYLTILHSILMQ